MYIFRCIFRCIFRYVFKKEARKIRKATICNEIIVSLLRKSKTDYYNNLNEKNICDNRNFWEVVKPLLSNKIVFNEKITLGEGEENITDQEHANLLKNYFSNIIKNLEIPQYNQVDPICQNVTTQ